MKKNFTLPILLILCFSAILNAQTNGCNSAESGWGSSLGTVTRGAVPLTISGNGIKQIWSDAVTATACNKTTFDGGTKENYNADCRSNADYPGDLFTWCAVIRFKDELCPDPWRVPTREDFVDLNKALGGQGKDGDGDVDLYIKAWGGAWSGFCNASGTVSTHGTFALYWSQTEISPTNGNKLHVFSSGQIYALSSFEKNAGFTLRCIR
jgi:uncharacterized protein (TIGR02145 family)